MFLSITTITTSVITTVNSHRQSLTVRWTVGEQYNFSSYDLTLHHHPSLRINCTGTAIYPNMSIIPQNRLRVNEVCILGFSVYSV